MPAPGDLRIVQDFLSTSDPGKADRLGGPRALADWLGLWGLGSGTVEVGEDDFSWAIEVREALRALVGSRHDGAAAREAVARLNRSASDLPYRLRFRTPERSRYEPSVGGFDGALAQLLGLVDDAQRDGSWERLKLCAEERCRAVFFDPSKNRSGKWCTERCGNRLANAAFRRRERRREAARRDR